MYNLYKSDTMDTQLKDVRIKMQYLKIETQDNQLKKQSGTIKKQTNKIKRYESKIQELEKNIEILTHELKNKNQSRQNHQKTRLQIKDILSIYNVTRTTLWRYMNKKEKKLLPIDDNADTKLYRIKDIQSFCLYYGIFEKALVKLSDKPKRFQRKNRAKSPLSKIYKK